MRILPSTILLVLVLMISQLTFAQRNSAGKVHARNSIGSKKQGKLFATGSENNSFPYHGFGIKLGDPFALTYKFYGDKKFSFAIDFGRTGTSLYNRYFREKFSQYAESDTFSTMGASLTYLSHKVKSDLVGEAKFLYHINGKEISPGLQLYMGLGWEWKNTRIEYRYQYINGNSESVPGSFKRNRLTMGPQLVLGVEYAYFQLPVSAFLELEYLRRSGRSGLAAI